MKAMTYHAYGSPEVLTLENVPTPEPSDDELRIRIHATAVNSADWRLRKADPWLVRLAFGLQKPNKAILGASLSGVVDKVGSNVGTFQVGDAVFGLSDTNTLGAYAEYVCVPADAPIALKPSNISDEEAAAIPFGAHTAWHFLRKAGVSSGQDVLIYGASGAVGTAAVQLAKHLGAKVTGVCSTANLELVTSLGADEVIDYREQDVDETAGMYDVIFDTVNKVPMSMLLKHVKAGGTLILGAGMIKEMLQGAFASSTSNKKVMTGAAEERAEDMRLFKDLVEAGVLKPVIDRAYPLEQLPEAHTYVEQGHKKGNVAISIG
jgi:2-desacetyl-2-hydroxyethyl bacteriochlorophyllide A dehydrogenase